MVDWFSCGRGKEYHANTNGRKGAYVDINMGSESNENTQSEFWGQKSIRSDMKIIRNGRVLLIDNLLLDGVRMKSSGGPTISERVNHADVFGTVILIGKKTKTVVEKLETLCSRETFHQHSSNIGRKRKNANLRNETINEECRQEKEPIYSCSKIGEENDAYVFRFVAFSIESGYMLLANVLNSMKEVTGVAPYEDRLQGLMYSLPPSST